MSLIEVKGLKKSFGSLDVLKGVDLTVEQGERVAIIGGSGCGKSVFLRSLCLLEKPDAGQIFIDGKEITAKGARVDALIGASEDAEKRMEEQLATIQEAGGDTALLEKQITEEHARRDTLLLERAGHANKEVHLRFLLELIEMLEPITTSSFDGRTRDGCGGRVTVKRTEHEPGACADEDEFFRLTRPRYHEGVIVDGQVVVYDNEMVIRYLDRVVVNDQNYEVQLKGGVTITI